jgi:hypothetical protein
MASIYKPSLGVTVDQFLPLTSSQIKRHYCHRVYAPAWCFFIVLFDQVVQRASMTSIK